MFFGKGKETVASVVTAASTPITTTTTTTTTQPPNPDIHDWMITNPIAEFLLMNTLGIQFLCLFAYAMVHGSKVFANAGDSASISYKFVSLIFSCSGGGIIVPILINGLPAPLSNDMLIIANILAFWIHHNVPMIREIMSLSGILKTGFIILYETTRAASVAKFTYLAGDKISPSLFSFPLMGPIICGTLGGCAGAFLPFNKGLEPIKNGLLPPMTTALIAAASFHLFMNSNYRQDVMHAKEKAQIHIALFFITTGLIASFKETKKVSSVSNVKKEN